MTHYAALMTAGQVPWDQPRKLAGAGAPLVAGPGASGEHSRRSPQPTRHWSTGPAHRKRYNLFGLNAIAITVFISQYIANALHIVKTVNTYFNKSKSACRYVTYT